MDNEIPDHQWRHTIGFGIVAGITMALVSVGLISIGNLLGIY